MRDRLTQERPVDRINRGVNTLRREYSLQNTRNFDQGAFSRSG